MPTGLAQGLAVRLGCRGAAPPVSGGSSLRPFTPGAGLPVLRPGLWPPQRRWHWWYWEGPCAPAGSVGPVWPCPPLLSGVGSPGVGVGSAPRPLLPAPFEPL